MVDFKKLLALLLALSLILPAPGLAASGKKARTKYKTKISKVVKKKAVKKARKNTIKKKRAAKKVRSRSVKKSYNAKTSKFRATTIKKKTKKRAAQRSSKQYAPAAVQPSRGSITIDSKNGQVDVYLNDEFAGRSPIVLKDLSPQKHLVEGYTGYGRVFRKEVDLSTSGNVEYSIDLPSESN